MKNTLLYIITRGLLIGTALFLFFHLYRVMIVEKIKLADYFQTIDIKHFWLETAVLLFSGMILAIFVRKQINNLKKFK